MIDQNGLLFPRGLGYAITAHSQSPEGRISAVPGSLCMTPLGMYSKVTGSGNTGWKKLAVEP
ncbi:hypothetical protein, partial [Novosphingobium sp. AAP1]|uniref:hypothetical protein n=1 Tax=Novosphingobium sp. AAP1 TaxID=1523413 RepID=UPI001E5E02B4